MTTNPRSWLNRIESLLEKAKLPFPADRDPRQLVQRVFGDAAAYAAAKALAERLPADATAADIENDPEALALATALRDRLNAILPDDDKPKRRPGRQEHQR